MAKLNANTLVTHPETGEVVLLAAGGDVPEWASTLVGKHLIEDSAAEDARAPAPTPAVEPAGQGGDPDGPPPKGGAGSGAPAWREYAAKHDVEVAEDASREDVIAALDGAGVPTE